MRCPYCNHKNPESEKLCIKCGLPLEPGNRHRKLSTDETRQLEDIVERADFSRWGPTQVSVGQQILLQAEGEERPFTLPLAKERLVLGRYDQESGTAPDVDLSRFNARDKGVSRRHAAFILDEDVLKIIDLNSSNSTYVNGQKLVAHQSRILQDGDELRLGNLIMRVLFSD
jgi:hypothetical protein